MFPSLVKVHCGGRPLADQENFRSDGRSHRDYRPMELETDVVSHASGSARLRLANTDILVGVKTEIDVPHHYTPDQGKLEFFIDCSANATPAFEGRGGEDLATELSSLLTRAYGSFPLRTLSILPGLQCWKLYADILILECGGNLPDAISLAVKAALHNTRVPRVTGAALDGGQVDLFLSDDPFDCWRLDVTQAPCLVTLAKIGEYSVVDATAEEELCSTASIVLAVTQSAQVTTVCKVGVGSLSPQTLNEVLKIGLPVGVALNKELDKVLAEEETKGPKRKRYGFLE